MKYLLPIILSLFSIYHSHAQSAEDKFGAWYMLDGTHKIADAWSIKTGFQLRSFEVLDNINLLFYYTGANYHINKNLTLTLMYSYLDIDRSFTISGVKPSLRKPSIRTTELYTTHKNTSHIS